jgi:hypothetical protein
MLSLNEKIDIAEMLMEYGDRRAGYLIQHYRNLHGDSETSSAAPQPRQKRIRKFQFTLKKASLYSPAQVHSKVL